LRLQEPRHQRQELELIYEITVLLFTIWSREYKIIGTRTFNLESLGSISVADVGEADEEGFFGNHYYLRRYPLCRFGHAGRGYIVVGEETYFQLHDKTQAGDNHGDLENQ